VTKASLRKNCWRGYLGPRDRHNLIEVNAKSMQVPAPELHFSSGSTAAGPHPTCAAFTPPRGRDELPRATHPLSSSRLFPTGGPVFKFGTRQRADFVHPRWHLALPRFPLPRLTSRTLPVSSLDYLRMSASFLNDSSVWLHTARSFSQFVLSYTPDHHGSTTGHRRRAASPSRSEWV
jgi:hypothetical protein